MITVALSATICASHDRVWRALVDPAARPLWDERVLGEIDLASGSRNATGAARRPARHRARRQTKTPTPAEATGGPAEKRDSIRTTRWRFQFGGVALVLQEEVVSADRHDRLVSRVSIGTIHFDQTLTFHREDDETGPRTRLGMKIVARNSIQVIGDVVPRLDVQKIVIEYVDTTLRQAQKFCEQDASPACTAATPLPHAPE